jgi:hypothetical protein
MCRWMAYFADPVPADELLFWPKHSIIDQSLQAQLGAYTTNGDGFGIGWCSDGNGTTPALFKSTHRLERRQRARGRPADPHAAAVRAGPRLDRIAGSAATLTRSEDHGEGPPEPAMRVDPHSRLASSTRGGPRGFESVSTQCRHLPRQR